MKSTTLSSSSTAITVTATKMTSTIRPEVGLAEESDLALIAPFLIPLGGESFSERFPDRTVEDFYRWKYFANPLGHAIVGIAAAGEAVVSVVAATPKRIWISSHAVLGYELGDFLTDENYRKMGLFSQLIDLVCREAAARGAALVYVRPNDISFPILAGKLSFHEAHQIDARRFAIPSYALARKTGIPASLLRVSGIDWLANTRCIPNSPQGPITVVPVEKFGEETDQLWQRAASGYDFALVRDSTYLNWRFAACPTPYKIWLARRNHQAAGFLVTSADRTAPTGAVVDLFSESTDVEAVQALLATAMPALLNSGVQLISTWTLQASEPDSASGAEIKSPPSPAQRLVQRAFPLRRKQPLHLAFKVLLPQAVTLPQPSPRWVFTLGDSDGA
jgi:GNAT superfamily N-acetyltransferase